VKGKFKIVTDGGRETHWLCRGGQPATKPFSDDAQKKGGGW